MARQQTRKNRRALSRRKRRLSTARKHRGGGWGFTGSASIPGQVNNPMVYTGIGDCRATAPGYQIPYGNYAKYTGLPGMTGGKRRSRKQKGGRYGFDLANPVPGAAAVWAGGIPPVMRIACEGSTPNPLNPSPHTPSTQPLPVAQANYWMTGGGPGSTHYGVGQVDSMYYYAPTAGYDNKPSTWVDSVGAPVQLQIPFAAQAMNQACLTTGGPAPLTGALMKGGGVMDAVNTAARTVGSASGEFMGAAKGLLVGTTGAAIGSAGQIAQAGNTMGRIITGQTGGGPLESVTDGLGRVVSGTTGLMGAAGQGVVGATGTLLSGTTGALGAAATGVARGTETTFTGLLDTGKALLRGGKRKYRNKNRKNNTRRGRKH